MIRIVLFTLLCLFNAERARAADPDSLWSRTFGDRELDDAAFKVREAPGGSIWVAGTARTCCDTSAAPYYGKATLRVYGFDKDGGSPTAKAFGDSGLAEILDLGVADNGATLIGKDGDGKIRTLRIDAAGNLVKAMTVTAVPAADTVGAVVIGNSVFLFGRVAVDTMSAARPTLVQLDSNGALKSYKSYGPDLFSAVGTLLKLSDGGILLVGRRTTSKDFLSLAKVNAAGDTVWTQRPDFFAVQGAFAARDGGFMLAGARDHSSSEPQQVALERYDAAGKSLWLREFLPYMDGETKGLITSNRFGAMSVAGALSGGYVVSGTSSVKGGSRGFIIKTDADGNLLWSNGRFMAGQTAGVDAISTQDSGFLALGTVVDSFFTSGSKSFQKRQILLLKYPRDSKVSGIVPVDRPGLRHRVLTARTLTEPGLLLGDLGLTAMEIRIYSTSGHLVRSVKSAPGSQAIWDGKNEVGNPLPLGRYFVGISSLEGLFSADFLWVR